MNVIILFLIFYYERDFIDYLYIRSYRRLERQYNTSYHKTSYAHLK